MTLQKDIERLSVLGANGLYGSNFLLTWEKTDAEIEATLDTARLLRELYRANVSTRVFDVGLAVSIFRDKSTRTRFSFASAANLLGLSVQDLDEEKSQIAHGETVRETAVMISFLTQVVGIRDDMYLGAGNAYMREFAAALAAGHREGTLMQCPTLVNLQCDIDHPTQSMADLAWLREHFGGLDRLRGKKLAMTWAYSPSYGKPLSVPQGIIGLMTRFGMNITLASPEGYDLLPDVMDTAAKQAEATGGSFSVVSDMASAFRDADIVYPKSWAPYHIMEQRTTLLSAGDRQGLKELEQQALANNARFTDWECTEELMALTRGGKGLYMHCLPADISGVSCRQGEVSSRVFDRYRLATYHEASWKPFVIAAMMLTARFQSPADVMRTLVERNTPRVCC